MPLIRVSEDTKDQVDKLARQLLELNQQGGSPVVRISRHRAGSFVSADEVVALALEALQHEINEEAEAHP